MQILFYFYFFYCSRCSTLLMMNTKLLHLSEGLKRSKGFTNIQIPVSSPTIFRCQCLTCHLKAYKSALSQSVKNGVKTSLTTSPSDWTGSHIHLSHPTVFSNHISVSPWFHSEVGALSSPLISFISHGSQQGPCVPGTLLPC